MKSFRSPPALFAFLFFPALLLNAQTWQVQRSGVTDSLMNVKKDQGIALGDILKCTGGSLAGKRSNR